MSLMPGAAFGRYEICRPLGAGGMGEVYLAIDTRLGRPTALKLLAPKLMEQREYLHRFEQEARAISALNHPNIITIYEVGEVNGKHFIATEFINGETLRRHMSSARLPLQEILRLATQIGDALVAAHETGIAHRDIKPENVMLRGDGILKVLDFGLAKLMEKVYFRAADPDLPTIPNIDTTPGAIVGTVMYMSPEQLRGLKVDGRTDIWSLGVILHELLAGRPPFEGRTNSDLIVSILEKEPAPLELAAPEAPVALRRIVAKALNKSIEGRYQTAKELTADLRRLSRDLEYAERQTSAAPESHTVKKRRGVWTETDPEKKPSTGAPAGRRATSGIEYIFVEIQKHRVVGTVVLIALALSLFYLWYENYAHKAPPAMRIDNVTNNGRSELAAISPDGKYVVYAEIEGATQTLFVRHISSPTPAMLVPSAEAKYVGLTFSPDGDFIYFVRHQKTDAGMLYRIPLVGGSAAKVMEDVDGPVAFSPDARRLAFVRANESEGEYLLVTADVDGSNMRRLVGRSGGARLSPKSVAWSADGKKIACAAGSWEGGFHTDLIEVEASTGAERKLVARRWFNILQVARPRDGADLYVCATEGAVIPFQIWRVSARGGEITKVTNDLSDYAGISSSDSGAAMVTVRKNRTSTIWVSRDGEFDQMRPVSTEVGNRYGLNWVGDDRLVSASLVGNNMNIFSIKSDGSDRRQLTADAGDNYHPSVSTDRRYIFFSSNRTGTFNLWRIDAQDGGNPKQLTNGEGDFHPYQVPDSNWVVYEHQKGGSPTLWKVSLDGGEPVRVTEQYSAFPAISPDGKLIACWFYIEEGVRGVAVLPVEGGSPLKTFPMPIFSRQKIRWTPDGQALTYISVEHNVSNIMRQQLNGGPPQRLTSFQSEEILSYDWSPDFSQLACARGSEFRDVAVIRIK